MRLNSVSGEQSVSKLLADLLVGVEKTSGVDERLVAIYTPKRCARANHQMLLKLIQGVSDAEAVAGGVDE